MPGLPNENFNKMLNSAEIKARKKSNPLFKGQKNSNFSLLFVCRRKTLKL